MLHSVEGIYRDGKVELKERGIDAALAAELRGRMQAFAEDWDRAEMDVYDDECAPSEGSRP